VVANPGFETPGRASWNCTGNCGADHGAGLARTGVGNAWVRHNTGWNDINQRVTVQANKTYTLTAWVRTSANNNAGYFGVRTTGGQVVAERQFGRYDGYTQLTVTVNTGSNTTLDVFAGLWANGDTWFQLDDVSLVTT
jgi:hypothetical protein